MWGNGRRWLSPCARRFSRPCCSALEETLGWRAGVSGRRSNVGKGDVWTRTLSLLSLGQQRGGLRSDPARRPPRSGWEPKLGEPTGKGEADAEDTGFQHRRAVQNTESETAESSPHECCDKVTSALTHTARGPTVPPGRGPGGSRLLRPADPFSRI